MNLSALGGNYGQLLNLFTNPVFLSAVKSAVKTGSGGSNKYDALFENLDKLNEILSKSSAASTAASSNITGGITAAPSTGSSEGLSEADKSLIANMIQNQALGQIVDSLIAKADLLEEMLDLSVLPPDDLIVEFFQKLRGIISKLDKETRKNHQEAKEKETKTEFKLLPSSSTKSGFHEGLILVAK